MKKRLFMVVLAILTVLGFNVKADAATAPSSFYVDSQGGFAYIDNYVSSLPTAYYKDVTISGTKYIIYCEEEGKTYRVDKNTTYSKMGELDQGLVYIMESKPGTGSTYKDYYIKQQAVWWYHDILEGSNNNISSSTKSQIKKNTDSVSKKIVELVNGAQSYKQVKGSVTFNDSNVKFTESNGYFVSNEISVKVSNLSKVGDVTIKSAPKGTTLVEQKTSGNNKYFKIKVPVSSVDAGKTESISLEISGSYVLKTAYEYKNKANSAWQKVALALVETTSYNVSDTMKALVTRPEEHHNKLIIKKVDESGNAVKDAELTLYKGDCTESTCSDKYSSWTTTESSKEFTDIAVGKYTLVETKTPAGYRTASKMLIDVSSDNKTFTYSMVDLAELKVRISKTDVTGEEEVPGATLELKKENGEEVLTWVSESTPKYVTLEPGIYTLTETIAPKGYKLSKTTITFKVDEKGQVYEKNANGEFVKVDFVKMVNALNDVVNISKLNSETNEYVSGAKLVLKNEKGETVDTWVTSDESHYVSLEAGIYILSETEAPEGYIRNDKPIKFELTEDGKILVANEKGEFVEANGIILYNAPEHEEVIVPATGLSSTLTYIVGAITLGLGATFVVRNGKEC